MIRTWLRRIWEDIPNVALVATVLLVATGLYTVIFRIAWHHWPSWK
jgi:hypothetical protein